MPDENGLRPCDAQFIFRYSGGKGGRLRAAALTGGNVRGGQAFAWAECRGSIATKVYMKLDFYKFFSLLKFCAEMTHCCFLCPFCPAFTQMEMDCRTDQRMFHVIGKTVSVEKIRLFPGAQFFQGRI